MSREATAANRSRIARAAAERSIRAAELMRRFAERTGVVGGRAPRRYLWTDAFAVCNLLGLERRSGDGHPRELALALVDQVHHTLGRHRPDEPKSGWLSGLGAAEGEAHPTRGGLRIGKPLPERAPRDPFDERLEWDRDGQYFHYLTKWMHALDQTARATGQPIFDTWAHELADTAQRAFTFSPPGGGPKRMAWKMSIDLSRPLVASMGQHDPLDGLVTYGELEATARSLRAAPPPPSLEGAIADFAAMIDPDSLATADPLGIGGLLVDALRIRQLVERDPAARGAELVRPILGAALAGLNHYARQPDLRSPADRRLAFRELGLSIGLAAAGRMEGEFAASAAFAGDVEALKRHLPLRGEIESFWLVPERRSEPAWLAYEDINDVMLATSLVPDGFLDLQEPRTIER